MLTHQITESNSNLLPLVLCFLPSFLFISVPHSLCCHLTLHSAWHILIMSILQSPSPSSPSSSSTFSLCYLAMSVPCADSACCDNAYVRVPSPDLKALKCCGQWTEVISLSAKYNWLGISELTAPVQHHTCYEKHAIVHALPAVRF